MENNLVSCCVGIPQCEVCDSALVSTLPPSSFRSSSQLSSSHAPGFAKLNRREGAGGWSPLSSDGYQWLEVDLGERTEVTAVATQGRYGSSDWLTSYLLMFSDTGHNWKQHRQEDSVGSFPGNSNADSVVQYKLQQPAVARFLRLIPLGWNPNGRIGLRLETYGCPHTSDVVSLDGSSSSLVYRSIPGWSPTSGEVVSLEFKTLRNSGTLLEAAAAAGGGSLGLELERGKLLLLLRQGGTSSSEPRRLASLGSLLDDQHWHHVAVEWRGAHLNLTVDKHSERVQIPAEFGHWDIKQLSVGAAQSLDSLKPLVSKRNFHGCLENLLYNGLNLIERAKHEDQQVTLAGDVTFSCAEPVSVAVTFPGPQSFLQLPGAMASASAGVSVGFQFRTWNEAGLLLTFDLPQEGGVVWLYLSEARLQLQIHKDGKALLELSAGCPAEDDNRECRNPFDIFQGCMRLLTVDDQPVDLILVQQRLLGNYSHLQIDMCGIIDRCSPSHCEHGGLCSQSWTVFHCNCSDSGYSGATCHSPVYEQSCEAYKHNGDTSGNFYIDVDGSGPIGPQLVYCNMTEEITWMVIQHNNTELTRVRPAPGVNRHLVHFDYSSREEQLSAITGQSQHCEQELSYHCRKSRLLNTPVPTETREYCKQDRVLNRLVGLEGSPFSWWLSGPGAGRLQTYWGGAQPGSRQCACGLRGDCVDPQHYCNCDADRPDWAADSGLLTHKESLPVRSLVLGDIQRPGSEAAYRVGPLRCHGDKNFWNAAFFDKETSYLHFPTFHGELSADISFLFKTSASSGVFLENLGIKDFIRIELRSSAQVVFSFDVGDGPLEVRVESSAPLDDGRWHRVRAERNVKEASLRLDELPAAARQAPADGHFHLQLNSQLFIGGTASRQKGFRGCIRSLQLNGVTLDLEERARITPGVRPGCPGHCGSYGALCRNRGRCAEMPSGFRCDCGPSVVSLHLLDLLMLNVTLIHTSDFTKVSAAFKPATSVAYTFKGPYELARNSSAPPSSIYSDVTPRGENVSLSFSTSQSPALLLYVGSYYREYLALLVNKHVNDSKLMDHGALRFRVDRGVVRIRRPEHLYNYQRGEINNKVNQNAREDFNLTSDGEFNAVRSLLLGRVQDSDELDPDLARLASLGFTGCLSVVHFNSISPLKAALLHPDSSPVAIAGPLVRSGCGASAAANPYAAENKHHLTGRSGSVGSGRPLVNAIGTDSALIGGVIAVAIFLVAAGLAIAGRLLYRRKETYRNQEVTRVEREGGPGFPFHHQTDSLDVSSQNPKEYFI
ncbi:hypothetical protein F2P81_000342 [Scophthalmus maximus]|uniref:Contactin-associated protein-like 4 n=1 Tax=Scophthalmus maximus TaxID=52904 RepID=A0A6A4TPB6_SCOMX|nr:hypothetical protein F2P81_000342 [Scophthalmus maximus]